jgi:hypothetical protein
VSEPQGLDRRALLRDALRAVEEMQAKVDAAERARHEPIAIVGMGCRFPGGANDPDTYWRLLDTGVDAIREVPADRWTAADCARLDPEAARRMPAQYGGFLDRIDTFDPHFFGIAPREAVTMDPQQRPIGCAAAPPASSSASRRTTTRRISATRTRRDSTCTR